MNDAPLKAFSNGGGERIGDSYLWAEIARFEDCSKNPLWRLRFGPRGMNSTKIDVDATPEILEALHRWAEKAAQVVRTDGGRTP